MALPYKDENFDIIMTQHGAMNVQNLKQFYCEAYRVLKSGGQFTLYDVMAGNNSEVSFPVIRADDADTSFLLKEEALKKVLIDQNFQIVHWLDRTDAFTHWIAEFSKNQVPSGIAPRLALHLIVGSDFGTRAANLAKSLKQGRANVSPVVATK